MADRNRVPLTASLDKKYPSTWFQGLSAEDKDHLIKQLGNSFLKDRLVSIIQDQLRSLKSKSSDYDNPSWAFKQADQNGQERAFNYLLRLFNPDQGD